LRAALRDGRARASVLVRVIDAAGGSRLLRVRFTALATRR
jgi:hypothetical protein